MGRRSNLSQITAYILPVVGSHPSQDDLNRFSRSSSRRCSVKTSVLKNFADFTGKQLGWSLLIKLKASNFIKKKTPTQIFFFEICKNFKNIHVHHIQKHLWTTAPGFPNPTYLFLFCLVNFICFNINRIKCRLFNITKFIW